MADKITFGYDSLRNPERLTEEDFELVEFRSSVAGK